MNNVPRLAQIVRALVYALCAAVFVWPLASSTAAVSAARKSAHFIEYAALAALLYRAFRQDSPIRWQWRWAIYSFATLAVWALLDEYRQSLTRTRGGSVYDSLLDMSGGLFALLVIALLSRRRPRRDREEFNDS